MNSKIEELAAKKLAEQAKKTDNTLSEVRWTKATSDGLKRDLDPDALKAAEDMFHKIFASNPRRGEPLFARALARGGDNVSGGHLLYRAPGNGKTFIQVNGNKILVAENAQAAHLKPGGNGKLSSGKLRPLEKKKENELERDSKKKGKSL